MTDLLDRWIEPALAVLAEWSLRWGVVLAVLAVWFALRPPRRAVNRHLLCAVALVSGLLLPLMPAWWVATISWPTRLARNEAMVREGPLSVRVDQPESDLEPRQESPAPRQVSNTDPAAGPQSSGTRRLPALAPPMLGLWQLALLGLAALWLLAVLLLGARLAGGQLLLARLRATSRPIGAEGERLLGECRQLLGLSRPVAMAVHGSINSPVALGGFRPLVLIPPDWNQWPESHQRACLLHELAHIGRRDDWAKLTQELVRVPFFFHPLVLWLLRRLDRERELLCDETVVRLGSDTVAYARLLLNLSSRPGRLLPAAPALSPGWLPFFDRGTVAVRIERLLEDDMTQMLPPPSRRRLFALGAMACATALGIGGLHVRAVEPQAKPPTAEPKPAAPETPRISGVARDADGQAVFGATIVAQLQGKDGASRAVVETDRDGKFTAAVPDGHYVVEFIGYKEGLAPGFGSARIPRHEEDPDLELKFGKVEPFSATLVDDAGRPVAGARVRVDLFGFGSETAADASGRSTSSFGISRVPREAIDGTPLARAFEATTDREGAFTIRARPPGAWLSLVALSADGRVLRVAEAKPRGGRTASTALSSGFVTTAPGETTRLVARPAARVAGRVVTRIPGLAVANLKIWYQDSRPPGSTVYYYKNLTQKDVSTGQDGRFVIDGLDEGRMNIFVRGEGENETWTFRAAQDVVLKYGETAKVTIELIRGVEVEGTVVAQGTGRPIEGASVGIYGAYRPRTGAATRSAMTGEGGRYRYRLPSGETYLYVMALPEGYTRLDNNGSSVTVSIPDGVERYSVPPLKLVAAVAVSGRVLDAAGAPVAGATVIGRCEGGLCVPFPGDGALTDAQGSFRLPPNLNNLVPVGKSARLLIRLRDGTEHEAVAVPAAGGEFTVKVAAAAQAPRGAVGPRDVAPDELAGVVVDAKGQPIEAVEADAWHWAAGNVTHTDRDGRFRLTKLPKDTMVPVRFRKEGYETQFHLDRVVGKPGWVIVLGNSTYFEGRVLDPAGKPVPRAQIRANGGMRRASGYRISATYTDTESGADGHYRLYVEPGLYDIAVRAPGTGVAGLTSESIATNTVRTMDIHLTPGIQFVARLLDSETGEPVPGVRFYHWDKPGIEGRSDAAGRVEIRDVPPGKYPRFQLETKGYARWWSSACLSEWSRYQKDAGHGFQRNFDGLDFEIGPDSKAVIVMLERAVTIRGRVLDPDGNPVAGATAAPALTGTGNSLTGDTRFSVETDADGRFTMSLPASGDRDYNLVAHDGKYGEWRTWANGVLPPFRTKAGQEIGDVTLRLSRPATVRGRVIDTNGKPVQSREVRASAADRLENRYYDPTTKTGPDGRFELKFVRAGEQDIQVAPFWLDANQAPEGTSVTLKLDAGEVKEGVEFKVPPGREVD